MAGPFHDVWQPLLCPLPGHDLRDRIYGVVPHPADADTLPSGNLSLIVHANYLMLGIMVGGFGLLGNEVMNRRFGQASLLAYSARSLPLSEKFIFLNFVIKDTVYYFFLWVLPFGFGYILASPFIGIPLSTALLLLLTLTLSFLFGLCGVFFLSAVYARSTIVTLARPPCIMCWSGRSCSNDGYKPGALFPATATQQRVHMDKLPDLLRRARTPFRGRDCAVQS